MNQKLNLSLSIIPDLQITDRGPISRQLLDRSIPSYRDAAAWVMNLPYGRNSDRARFSLVLSENRGTCSTKHALLAELANELEIPNLELMVGIYYMNEQNTPGVGAVLHRHGLSFLPEAHCYLLYAGSRCDFTKADCTPLTKGISETAITPDQIGVLKESIHKQYLKQWIKSECSQLSEKEIWHIRERCIAALSLAAHENSRTEPNS